MSKVINVDLESLRKNSLRISLIQLESPFDTILETQWRTGGHVFSLDQTAENKYASRIDRMMAILRDINKQAPVDVVLLPEYAFLANDSALNSSHNNTLETLAKYAVETDTIVAGNYYRHGRNRVRMDLGW